MIGITPFKDLVMGKHEADKYFLADFELNYDEIQGMETEKLNNKELTALKTECLQQSEALTHRFYQYQPLSNSEQEPMDFEEP